VQRQQTRWLVFPLLASLLLFVVLNVPTPQPGSSRYLLERMVNYLSTLSLSLAVLIAILRYRLWDIDLIIRRTLIYSLLAGLLALAYFGSVVALESVFRSLTGQGQNQLVTVVSTLAIAALFVPLRSRVQAFIDRRFYRQKYDAARILSQFGASVRDDVDLDDLTARLVAVAEETLQPASVGVWLHSPAQPPSMSRQSDQGAP
jgi:hypothetical protein